MKRKLFNKKKKKMAQKPNDYLHKKDFKGMFFVQC